MGFFSDLFKRMYTKKKTKNKRVSAFFVNKRMRMRAGITPGP